jgi:hypothetical protein
VGREGGDEEQEDEEDRWWRWSRHCWLLRRWGRRREVGKVAAAVDAVVVGRVRVGRSPAEGSFGRLESSQGRRLVWGQRLKLMLIHL